MPDFLFQNIGKIKTGASWAIEKHDQIQLLFSTSCPGFLFFLFFIV
jgi:hypothetical protein